ncbi:transposase IS3/IS911 family protein [Parafrankia sp. EAN1pec]|uniref:transposase n=1 Tax=Parafrankia sp. (strain EAN1pec) TaxID=298653 RepID=UPI00015D9DFB|nr:transposase IS3/IS911 family protein [Frankia sp. EAN1pec]
MGATRRRFTEEYKELAVTFVIDGGRSVAEVARNIGVHEMTLGKWMKKAQDEAGNSQPPDTGAAAPHPRRVPWRAEIA